MSLLDTFFVKVLLVLFELSKNECKSLSMLEISIGDGSISERPYGLDVRSEAPSESEIVEFVNVLLISPKE